MGAVQNPALLSIVLGRGIAWQNAPMTWRQITLNVLLVHQTLYLVCCIINLLAFCSTHSQILSVVYFKQQSGYATFRMNKQVEPDEWRAVWDREGFESVPESLYFYESPPGGPHGVWGYFSFSPTPGTPHRHWTPETDDAGESWGWTFVSEDWTVEISKYVF